MKTLIAYSFNELDKFARNDAKCSVRAYERLSDFFSNKIVQTLKDDFGLHHLKTFYSLLYCQDDGLYLCGQITASELFNNDKFKKIAFKGINHKQIIESISNELTGIDFTNTGNDCYNANTVSIESNQSRETEENEKQMVIIYKVVKNVEKWYFKFCKEWEKRGYKYFNEISDEDMNMICTSDNLMFTKEGFLINKDEYLELTA